MAPVLIVAGTSLLAVGLTFRDMLRAEARAALLRDRAADLLYSIDHESDLSRFHVRLAVERMKAALEDGER